MDIVAKKKTVLVVEDEEALRFVLSTNLRRAGYDVKTAKTAEGGLTLARKLCPDLVLLDVMLPGMNGLELLRLLRLESEVPVLLLSARTAPTERVSGLRLGADDYITKPFCVEELLERVKTRLSRRRGPLRKREVPV